MLDLGLLMYGGLLLLAFWRVVCFYRCCGMWLSFLNYTSLLYLILSASLVYSTMEIYKLYQEPLQVAEHADAALWSVPWLRPFVIVSPACVILSLILCWFQTEGHVFEIHKGIAVLKHDRAVQIVALPAVFAVMALASMVPILELATGNISPEMLDNSFGMDVGRRIREFLDGGGSNAAAVASQFQDHMRHFNKVSVLAIDPSEASAVRSRWDDSREMAIWRYETCLYVGDLFEAWSLYQFGLLALEFIRESFEGRLTSSDERKSYSAPEILASLGAVRSLAWLGTIAFVVVCVGQTACSLSPYVGGSTSNRNSIMHGFQVAGFIASASAIYNIVVVERAFHAYLSRVSPWLKFSSVKLLMTISFFQKGLLVALQELNRLLPDIAQRIVAYLPIFGDIINMTELQLNLFYNALILYECLLISLLHLAAWNPNEQWYFHAEVDDAECADECKPLLLGKTANVDEQEDEDEDEHEPSRGTSQSEEAKSGSKAPDHQV